MESIFDVVFSSVDEEFDRAVWFASMVMSVSKNGIWSSFSGLWGKFDVAVGFDLVEVIC